MTLIKGSQTYTALAVAIVLVLMGGTMWYCFPFWDDAQLFILVKEHGFGAIWAHVPDRPLVGVLMSGLWALGLIPAIIVSLALWAVLGLLSARVLATLFPSVESYAPLCILLTVSPVLTKCHLPIFNVTSTALIAVILAYLGLFAVRSYVMSGEKYFHLISGLFLFGLGILISEYAVPVSLMTLVLLTPAIKNEQVRSPAVKAWALLTGVTALSYTFIALRARSNTTPSYVFENLSGMLQNLPVTLFGSLWQSLMGAYAESLGYLSQLSMNKRYTIVSMVLGVVLALLLYAACRSSEAPKWKELSIPFAALLIGILPVCLMYRTPYPDLETRFFLPVIPLASAIFVVLLAKAFKDKLLPALLVGMVCASATGQLVVTSIREQRALDRFSQALRQGVADSPDLVVAVLPTGGPDYAKTGRIVKDWPLDLELKFWAYNKARADQLGPPNNCKTEPFFRDVRLVQRSSTVYKVILVNEDSSLEPYCK